jgi:hypothetical protein
MAISWSSSSVARLSKLQFARSLLHLGGRRGMKHMLDYLVAHPEKGLLAYEMGSLQSCSPGGPSIILRRSPGVRTILTWRSGASTGAELEGSSRTGIWHETYLVQAGQYEAVYGNMPPHGLCKAGRLVPASESSTARARLRATSLNI